MTTIVPNTFATREGSIQLSELDENFNYLASATVVGATSFVNVATLIAGTGATGATGSITASSTVQGALFKTSNWTITGASGATGALYFAWNGTNVAKLESNGKLTVTGDITAYGTI
jgi:hypothetical protein